MALNASSPTKTWRCRAWRSGGLPGRCGVGLGRAGFVSRGGSMTGDRQWLLADSDSTVVGDTFGSPLRRCHCVPIVSASVGADGGG